MKRATAGFTLVEILVAVVVLGVGITALAGSSALVTRMIGRGQRATRAAEVAAQRLEKLRLYANATTPRCTHAQFAAGGPAVSPYGVTETWTIAVTGAKTRTLTETVSYPTVKGQTHTDVLTTIIQC